LNRTHRPHFLLSGLLTCGVCGGGYTIVARDRYGCATRRGKGTCANDRTISRQRIETRVLSGLKDRLLAPDLVAEFLRAFADEVAARQHAASGAHDRLTQELAEIERRLAGVLRAIEDGAWSDVVRTRLHDLEQRKAAVTAALAEAATPAPTIALHPGGIELYRTKIAELERSPNSPEIKTEAIAALRSMIETVALTPDTAAADGLRAELRGDLATILSLAPGAEAVRASGQVSGTSVRGSLLSVVAGARSHLYRTQIFRF